VSAILFYTALHESILCSFYKTQRYQTFFQYGHSGGGSGGNIYLKSDVNFELTGRIYCNGGGASSQGGGGAGGRVHAYFLYGNFHTGYIQAKGRKKNIRAYFFAQSSVNILYFCTSAILKCYRYPFFLNYHKKCTQIDKIVQFCYVTIQTASCYYVYCSQVVVPEAVRRADRASPTFRDTPFATCGLTTAVSNLRYEKKQRMFNTLPT